jgi:PAS domain S-box-containing protein
MNIPLAPRLARRSRLFTQIASIAVILLGILVLTGWQLQFEGFKSILSGLLSMAPTTAAGMLVCGAALNLLSQERAKAFRFLATALAMVAIALGLLVLSEYFFGWDLPLDHWLSRREAEPSQLVRMAPTTALCFILTGGAVFTAPRRIRSPLKLPLVAALGAAVMVIGVLALIGHVFDAVSGFHSWNYTGMAVHTAAGFLLLGSTTLGLARSRATLGWSLNATTTGGFLLGIVLMVAVAAVSYNLTRQLQRTGILVGHSQEILKEIEEVEVSMLELETDQHSYIITGDETLLEERDALETAVQEHLDKLRELTSDNPNQRRRLDRIQPLIAERIRRGDETLLARRRSGFSAAQERVSAGTGRALLEECNRIFKEMEDDEYALLAKRQKYSETASQMTFLLLPLGVFLSLAGLSLGLFFLNAGMGERKQAEHSLRQSEEGMRAILDSTLDCIITMDHHGRVVVFNPAAEKTFGYPREKAIGQLLSELIIPPLLRDRHQKGLSRYLATGEAQVLGKRLEMTAMRSDGSEFPVELAITRIGSQEPPMFTGFIRDITERRFSDEAIRASEQRFSSFMDNIPGFAWIKDAESRYAYGNKFFHKLLLLGGEWRGRTVEEVWPPEIAAPLRANDEKVIETKAPLQTVETIVQAGEKRVVLSSKFPILNANGEVAFICGIGIDITERKQAEERLREQARLLDLAQDAIMVRDMEDRVEFWNQGAEKLYGWTAAEVDCKKACDFLYKDEPGAAAAARAAVIKDGKWAGECTHNCQDGGTVTVRSRWTLVRDELEAPKSVLIINTDVTEQKKLETHLMRAQRLESIGTLASGVAHDLNNILTPILICAEILRENPTEEDATSSIALIEESAKRGANVVKQVLTFARGIEGERVVIKPSHLIQEIIDIAQKTFPKSIEISSRYPEDLWSVEVDPTQLHQVLLNLSVNARDAMPQGGSLIIAAENFNVDQHYASTAPGAKEGPYVLLRVSDTGSGMSRAVIDKIFDPFFTTKKAGKGTGLGLSTAFGIVKSHGGFISVSSEIGRGTSFKIFLPAQLKELPRESRMTPEALKGHGELVLLVDDEANILRVTKLALENKNYHVVSASDGREALKIFSEQGDSIKAVLTDMGLPHMDGVALIRAIKKMKPEMVFIASTGQDEENRVSELQALGVSNFLGKPYDTQTLLTKVRDTLAHELTTI